MSKNESKYVQTDIGMIPVDWNVSKISQLCEVVRGSSPRPAGSPKYFNGDYIPWITVAELTNIPESEMYVDRSASCLTKEGSLQSRILESGTLLLANSGATLGVPKILKMKSCANDGIAAFLNLKEKECSKEYLYYYLQSLTNYFREVIAPGNGQPNLNTSLIGETITPIPPIKEQRKIATILQTWDKATAQTQKLIDAKEKLKKGLMQKLLTGEVRFKEFKKEKWVEKNLGDCLDYIQPTPYLVSSTEYDDSYETPVLTAGKTFILGYTNEKNGIFNKDLPVIIFDDFTTATQFVDFPFKAKSSAMKILIAKSGCDIKFLYEILQVIQYEIGAHERHWISKYSQLKVRMPSKNEQKKISSIISKFDIEIKALENMRDGIMKQKEGLMQQLLTGKKRVKIK